MQWIFQRSFWGIIVISVFNKWLVEKGIVRIGDLIAENSEIITCKQRELNLCPLDAFQLFSVIDALPKDWRHALKCYGYDRLVSFDLHEQTQLFLSGKEVLLSNADSKGIHKEIRDGEIVQPTAQKKCLIFWKWWFKLERNLQLTLPGCPWH